MILTFYRLYCTECGREYKEPFDDKDDLLFYASQNGWIRKKVENGSEWDFCPKCVEKLKLKE